MAVKTVLVALTLSLLATSRCESKVIRGTANSLEAWKQNGQFIAKFCFHGESSLLILGQLAPGIYTVGTWARGGGIG